MSRLPSRASGRPRRALSHAPSAEKVVGLDSRSLRLSVGSGGLAHPDAVIDRERGCEQPPASIGLPDQRGAGLSDAAEVLELGVRMEVVELVGAVDWDRDAGGHHDLACDRFASEAGGAAPGVFDARAAGLQSVGGD